MLLGNKCIGTCAYMGGTPALLEEFVWSWSQMVQFNAEGLCGSGEFVHYDRAKVSFHSYARNTLTERMQGDWLFMLDTDHQFEPDICARMLDRLNVYNADVVVGMYQQRTYPHLPVLYLKQKEGDLYEQIGAWRPAEGNMDAFYVDSSGAGCMMIRRSVFDRIKKEFKEGPFDIIPPLGEDHSFARRLTKLGIKMLCDPHIECNHLLVRPVTLDDYDRNAVQLGEEEKVEAFKIVPD